MTNPVEKVFVDHMTKFMAGEFKKALDSPNVSTREAVDEVIQSHIKRVSEQGALGTFEVVCDERNNRPSDIEQGKLNVMMAVPSWIAEQIKQQYEGDDLAWPTMPTHGPILAKYNEFIEQMQPFKASTVPGFDGSIGWFFASNTCSLYIDFLPDERVRVYWHIDPADALPLKLTIFKHEGVLEADVSIASLLELIQPAYECVAQARATDDIMKAIDLR